MFSCPFTCCALYINEQQLPADSSERLEPRSASGMNVWDLLRADKCGSKEHLGLINWDKSYFDGSPEGTGAKAVVNHCVCSSALWSPAWEILL